MIGRSVCAAISLTIVFGEAAADRRRADQHGRLHAAHHLGQTDAVSVPVVLPAFAFGGGPRVGRLIVAQLIGHIAW